MTQNAILIKNEQAANRFASKVMLYTIIFLVLVYVLNVIGVFLVEPGMMTLAMGLSALLLALPAFLVFILKRQGSWVKYVIVSSAATMVFIMISLLQFHVIVLYAYAIAISSLYFSTALSIYTAAFSFVILAVAQVLGTFVGIGDKNYSDMFATVVYGIAPRSIQFLVLCTIFIMLSRRTHKLLENMMGAEEQADLLNNMVSVTQKCRSFSDDLMVSVERLSSMTDNTIKANEQIAGNTQKIVEGSEDTIRRMDDASKSVASISHSIGMIADESKKIAAISEQVRTLTEDNGRVLTDAEEEMASIVDAAKETKDIIGILEKRSVEISGFVEVITGISEQTNMLALNAAIESARAGEQGRGFAVVASEIRALAEQSQKAVKDIETLIGLVMADTQKAVESMDRSSELVDKGVKVIKEAAISFSKVSDAGREMHGKISDVSLTTKQVVGESEKIVAIVDDIRDINKNGLSGLQEIAAAGEEQLAAMQEVAASVSHIEHVSGALTDVVKK